MGKIEVEIKGLSPLLMHSPKAMLIESETKVKSAKKTISKDDEAEQGAYRTSKGFLYVPSTAIKGAMLNACSFKKIKKYSLKPFVAGGVIIPQEELDLLTYKNKPIRDYLIDSRTVVIPSTQGRILKHRPKIPEWKLCFTLEYDEKVIGNTKEDIEIIKEVLSDAGNRIGILDFRPQKSGSFGRFEITKWKVIA